MTENSLDVRKSADLLVLAELMLHVNHCDDGMLDVSSMFAVNMKTIITSSMIVNLS